MKCLLVIDTQKGLFEKALYHKEAFITTTNAAIQKYRALHLPVVFMQHNSNLLPAGTPAWEIAGEIDYQQSDPVFQKSHGNAFEKTELGAFLKAQGVSTLLICGLVTHGCVRATSLGALAEGFQVELLKQGHTLWNKDAAEKIQSVEAELSDKSILVITVQDIKG